MNVVPGRNPGLANVAMGGPAVERQHEQRAPASEGVRPIFVMAMKDRCRRHARSLQPAPTGRVWFKHAQVAAEVQQRQVIQLDPGAGASAISSAQGLGKRDWVARRTAANLRGSGCHTRRGQPETLPSTRYAA